VCLGRITGSTCDHVLQRRSGFAVLSASDDHYHYRSWAVFGQADTILPINGRRPPARAMTGCRRHVNDTINDVQDSHTFSRRSPGNPLVQVDTRDPDLFTYGKGFRTGGF